MFFRGFLISLLVAESLAGSRFFEAARTVPHGLDLLNNGTEIHTQNKLAARAYAAYWNEDIGPVAWPNAVIKYCFELGAESKLKNDLKDAMDIWYNNGLPAKFKMEQAASDICTKARLPLINAKERADVLMIKYSADGILRTTIGKVKPSSKEDRRGPSMILSDKEEHVGTESKHINYAHEIGHAFGLAHDHQRPLASLEIKINCENLADYEKFAQNPLHADRMDDLCNSYSEAASVGFSAAEFLEMHHSTLRVDGDDIDFNSIMVYGSPLGGRVVNGQRLNVMTRTDGSPIPINRVPSPGDIAALMRLYPDDAPSDGDPTPNQPGNPQNEEFREVEREAAGCSNTGGGNSGNTVLK